MKVIRSGEGHYRKGSTFTGHVELKRVLPAQEEGGVSLTLVRFSQGALTHWHVHPGEQVLVVMDGRGRVGNEEEQFEIGPGDVVYTPPGEKHWHGATPDASMTHLSITTIGSPEWLGPVE